MRRIYESDALHRDDDPLTPSEGDGARPGRPVTANLLPSLLDWSSASHAVLPRGIRERAVEVSVATDRRVYDRDDPVGIRVRLDNRLPLPVALRTPTRRRWDWTVDGDRRAEREEVEPAPAEQSRLAFHRSETKTFTRTWHQRVRTGTHRWTPVEAGTYEIAAFVDVDDPVERGLRAATEIEIRD